MEDFDRRFFNVVANAFEAIAYDIPHDNPEGIMECVLDADRPMMYGGDDAKEFQELPYETRQKYAKMVVEEYFGKF